MYNVLIVDDELIVRHAVQTLIRWEDSRLQYAGSCANGRSALEMLSSTDVDIVITDIKMPELDGIQLIKQLRASGYEGEILVLSNYNDFELVREALKQGAHDYVLKLTMNADNFMDVLREMVTKLDQRPQRTDRLFTANDEHPAEQKQHIFAGMLNELVNVPSGERYTAAQTEQMEYDCEQLWNGYSASRLVTLFISLPEAPHDPIAEVGLVQPFTRLLQELFAGEQVLLANITDTSLVAMITAGSELDGMLQQLLERFVSMVGMYYNVRLHVLYTTGTVEVESVVEQFQRCLHSQGATKHGSSSGDAVLEAAKVQPQASHTLASDPTVEWIHYSTSSNTNDQPSHLSNHLSGNVSNDLSVDVEDESADTQVDAHTSSIPNHLPATQWRAEVRQVVSYLQQNYAERIHLPEIAASVHLSEAYLCSIFKAETGKSILTCLNDIRMDRACELLSSRNMLVKEVAAEVGIHDPFYFNRLFKKRYGISPKKVKTGITLPPLT